MRSKVLVLGVMFVSVLAGEKGLSSAWQLLQKKGYVPQSERVLIDASLSYTAIKLNEHVALMDTVQSKSSEVTFLAIVQAGVVQELTLLKISGGHGAKIQSKFWLRQFKGLPVAQIPQGVDAISGATLVSDDVKQGVARVIAHYQKQQAYGTNKSGK